MMLTCCSCEYRALQTVEPLAKRRNLKMAVEPGFQCVTASLTALSFIFPSEHADTLPAR